MQIAAIPLVGPVGAALVAAVPGLVRRSSPVKDLFNTAQRVLLVLAGAAAYSLVGGAQHGQRTAAVGRRTPDAVAGDLHGAVAEPVDRAVPERELS